MGKIENIEFKEAIAKRRILPFPKGKHLVTKELKESGDDLKEAQDRFENEKYKYATIMAYYSIFHAARALVYSKCFREKSHYFLLVALKALFVEEGVLEQAMVRKMHDAMILREDADYHGEFSETGAEELIKSAEAFLEKAKEILVK